MDQESSQYLKHQLPRYVFLLRKVKDLVIKIKKINPSAEIKILDVGPAFQTELMRHKLKEVVINSIGFENIYFKPKDKERHIQFDLNELQSKENWPDIEKHDLVIMAGVIEHLYTNPETILNCIHGWLEKQGFLIIQTPNAVRLAQRLKLLVGINPQEMIRQERRNPGHFREYTKGELINLGRKSGFGLIEYSCDNYRKPRSDIQNILYNAVCNCMPPALRDQIYICFQKAE